MFTKSDYSDYFNNIKRTEQKMINLSGFLLSNIDDIEAQKLLTLYHQEEIEHKKIVEKIIEMIK